MAPEPPQSLATEGVRSLEVRWIFLGRLETAMAGWFGRFPAGVQAREDTYLLDPQLRGLSVKIRGGGALEVKAYRGSPGILEVAGRARGRMESWQKWSFPFTPPSRDSGDPVGWRQVHKKRRISRFSLDSGQIVTRAPGLGREPGCEVELTQIRTRGRDWWSLGFEATGSGHLLRSELEPPPHSYLPSLCRAGWNPARMNPGLMHSGWTSNCALGVTPRRDEDRAIGSAGRRSARRPGSSQGLRLARKGRGAPDRHADASRLG